MSAATLHLLCAGAVQGLVKALEPDFVAATGAVLDARYGAVGALKEALGQGAACDAMIVTDAMVVELQRMGALSAQLRAPLGTVRTGIAVRRGAPHPDVSTTQALAASLDAAPAIYLPDPKRATAGIHFESVLRQLGLLDTLAARLRTFPNGATAMRELAAEAQPGAIGCTQITEILYTPGLELVGALPAGFELATVYTAALGARAAQPALAQRFIELLAGPHTRARRAQGGFEF